MPGAGDYRECYVHTRKPAIRNCLACGRPICGKCGELSGDPLRCVSCVEAARCVVEEKTEVPPGAPEGSRSSLRVGEVTVFDDGTVETPEPPPASKAPSQEPLKERPRPGPAPAAPGASRKEQESDVGKPPMPGPPDEDGSATSRERKRSDRRMPVKRLRQVPADPSGSKAGGSVPGRKKPPKKPRERTGPLSQIAYALPCGVGTAVLLAGAWLLLAKFSRQWTQISIFTIGIAVPWTLFNATTMKKRMGKKVWTSPPPTWMISALSFAIVSLLTPAIQFLAYKVMYGGNPARLPYSDFAMRYFKWSDWLLVSCGLLLALLLPLMLRAGADLSVRSIGRKAPEVEGALDGEVGETEPAAETSVATGEGPVEGAKAGAGPGEEDAGDP